MYTLENSIPVQAEVTSDEATEVLNMEQKIESRNLRLSLVPSKRKKVKKINMIIEGEFNVGNADLVLENYEKLREHFDFISISLRNIDDIDLAAVQLLRMLKCFQEFSQKTITIDSELSQEKRNLLSVSGLLSEMTYNNNTTQK